MEYRNAYQCEMKYKHKIEILLVLVVLLSPEASAKLRRSGGKVWSDRMNRRGLYMRNNRNSQHTMSLTFSPLYYSGDVELPGSIFTGHKEGPTKTPYTAVPGKNDFLNNAGFGVGLQYGYRAHPNLGLRAQLMGGVIRGHAEFTRPRFSSNGYETTNYFLRDFQSFFLEYSVGMEIYPSAESGFYFFVGVGGMTGFIHRDQQSLTADGHVTSGDIRDFSLVRKLSEEDKFVIGTVPILPVGIGYTWKLQSWRLGVELMLHPALMDQGNQTMDGWVSGNVVTTTQASTRTKANVWTDSFMQLGITIGWEVP